MRVYDRIALWLLSCGGVLFAIDILREAWGADGFALALAGVLFVIGGLMMMTGAYYGNP